MSNRRAILKMRELLMRGKKYRYVRYLHAREAFKKLTDVKSILVVQAGTGHVELALAAEFPSIKFTVTEKPGQERNLEQAKLLARRYGIANVAFATFDVTKRDIPQHDLVYSVEVLETHKNYPVVARNMRDLARKYIFCLTSYANDEEAANPERQARVLQKLKKHTPGFSEGQLAKFFPTPVAFGWCYWSDAGQKLRARLQKLERPAIVEKMQELTDLAKQDVKAERATSRKQAQGIWVLARKAA